MWLLHHRKEYVQNKSQAKKRDDRRCRTYTNLILLKMSCFRSHLGLSSEKHYQLQMKKEMNQGHENDTIQECQLLPITDNCPIVTDNFIATLYIHKSSFFKNVNSPISVGIDPVRPLCFASRYFKAAISPISLGIVPLRVLLATTEGQKSNRV